MYGLDVGHFECLRVAGGDDVCNGHHQVGWYTCLHRRMEAVYEMVVSGNPRLGMDRNDDGASYGVIHCILKTVRRDVTL